MGWRKPLICFFNIFNYAGPFNCDPPRPAKRRSVNYAAPILMENTKKPGFFDQNTARIIMHPPRPFNYTPANLFGV